jgi:tellurite resistance protein
VAGAFILAYLFGYAADRRRFVVSSFVSAMKSMFAGSASEHDWDGPLKLAWETYSHEPEEGEAFEAYLLVVSGTVRVPMENCPARITVTFEDTTDEELGAVPVLCRLPRLANSQGQMHLERSVVLDGSPAVLKGYPLALLPHSCLHLASTGERTVTMTLTLQGTEYYSDTTYGAAALHVPMSQATRGYGERARSVEKGESSLATLAMAMCASDGHVDARETALIQAFFRQQTGPESDRGLVSKRVTDAMEDALSSFYWQGGSQKENIQRACTELKSLDDEALLEIAYELCLDVVAADTEVTKEERLALEQAGTSLGLSGAQRELLEHHSDEMHRLMQEADDQMNREGLA